MRGKGLYKVIWLRKNIAVVAAVTQLIAFLGVVAYGAGDRDRTIEGLKKSQINTVEKVERLAKDTTKTAAIINNLQKEQKTVKDAVESIDRNHRDTIKELEAVKREQAALKAIQSRIERDLGEVHRDIKALLQKLK
jgi:chromosome segregation ATPase